MRIPSAPRRTGARIKPVHFTYVGVERGAPTEAYIAGPTWWGWLHMSRPSKPCVYELTAGKIPCRFCAEGRHRVAAMKGWVPLYRRVDGLAWMVPVDEAQRDVIDALKPFTKVAIGRGSGKGVGVWVNACTNQEPVWSSTLPERKVSADVTDSLITVWGVQEVTSFFCGVSDNALSLDIERGEERERDRVVAISSQPKTARDPADANATFAASVNRINDRTGVPKPSANGRHDKE